uniref:FLYWCH-type domain-containing protein n=1 Tax=Strongyloides venezuelensis TaxID=75913 RepID=A0A0K0FJS6_STRVS
MAKRRHAIIFKKGKSSSDDRDISTITESSFDGNIPVKEKYFVNVLIKLINGKADYTYKSKNASRYFGCKCLILEKEIMRESNEGKIQVCREKRKQKASLNTRLQQAHFSVGNQQQQPLLHQRI